jgi:hypothetical protein
MHDYPEAYTFDNLRQIINANDSCPSVADDELKRLVDLAKQRASKRGEESALDDTQTECIIATDWTGFASGEFGYDNGDVNQFAMGVLEEEVSAGKGATLFSDSVVVQRGWMETGDGRRAQVQQYEDEDYDNADAGEFWIPNSAQDYIAIVALGDELLHGEVELADAM